MANTKHTGIQQARGQGYHSESAHVALLVGNFRYRCVHVTEEIGAWYSKEFGNEFSVLEPRKGNGNSDLLSLSLPQSLGEKKPGPPPPDSCG